MKIRSGFVSNSSSSSFVIYLGDITDKQLNKIKNHIHFAQKMRTIEYKCEHDAWNIEVDEEKNIVRGWTWVDNFDMHEFLAQISVASDTVSWEEY